MLALINTHIIHMTKYIAIESAKGPIIRNYMDLVFHLSLSYFLLIGLFWQMFLRIGFATLSLTGKTCIIILQ